MTVNANVVEKRIVPNGVTSEIDCPGLVAFKAADIVVKQYDALGSVVAIPDYTVEQLGDPAGVKIVSDAPWTADPTGAVVVERDTEPLQQLDYEDFLSKPAEVQEAVPDLLTLMAQEAIRRGKRSVRLHPYDEGELNPLPPLPNLLGKVLGVTLDGKLTGLANVPVAPQVALSAWGQNFVTQPTLSEALDVLQFSALGKSIRTVADTAALVTLLGRETLLAQLGWKGLIHGLTYANNAGDPTNDIDVAAGGCMSDDGTTWIEIAATTKQLDVAWAPDNGATPTGMLGPAAAIGNHDYLMYAIKNPATGASAVIAEKADAALVLPAGYTKKKAFGFIQRTAGAVAAFTTYETAGGGLEFWWTTPVLDFFHANTLTTARRTDAIRVPKVFSVLAHVTVQTYDATTGTNVRITRVGETDLAVTTDASNGGSANMGHYPGVLVAMAHISLRTSADGKIAARAQSTVVDQYNCVTNGFTWSRR